MASEELSISLLAGSCVGGGTTLNWCAAFRTPKHVRKDWAETCGLEQFVCEWVCGYSAAVSVCLPMGFIYPYRHGGSQPLI